MKRIFKVRPGPARARLLLKTKQKASGISTERFFGNLPRSPDKTISASARIRTEDLGIKNPLL